MKTIISSRDNLRILNLMFLMILVSSIWAQVGGWDPEAIKKADETIEVFKEKDAGIETFFQEAYGYAVFPGIAKAASGIGGAHGTGTVFQAGDPSGKVSMTQIAVGFQFGGQVYSEVIFFEDQETLDAFKEGDIEFAGRVSAVAVTKGVSADIAYENGVAIFTMTKAGLMYEASIGGQKFKFRPFEMEQR